MPPRSRPSITASTVAAVRRRVDRPAVPTGDPAADDRLARSLLGPVPVVVPGLGAYLEARTRFFDRTLLDACERGAGQVVIVGAGYDGRALRFRQPGVRFFEIDHPATQADKLVRLRALGIDHDDVCFVPVDLGRDPMREALAAAGHDAAAPSHVLCEGVTPYLPLADLRMLVQSVAAVAAPGTTFAVDFAEPPEAQGVVRQAMLAAVRFGTALVGERMVTLLSRADVERLLVEGGWGSVALDPPDPRFPVVFALASR